MPPSSTGACCWAAKNPVLPKMIIPPRLENMNTSPQDFSISATRGKVTSSRQTHAKAIVFSARNPCLCSFSYDPVTNRSCGIASGNSLVMDVSQLIVPPCLRLNPVPSYLLREDRSHYGDYLFMLILIRSGNGAFDCLPAQDSNLGTPALSISSS